MKLFFDPVKIKLLVSFLVMTVVVCGCGVLNKEAQYVRPDLREELQLSYALRFDDVPVPTGFVLNRKDSFIFQNSQTRMGTLSYDGITDFELLVNFFKKQMEVNGWRLKSSVEFDEVILNFENKSEGCIVRLGKTGKNKARVIVNLSPLSSGKIDNSGSSPDE
ncbi:MAG: hypothetical protein KKF93_01990 [Candidatus Omnitrophica bacterium]|nr:hypothetical protein [Candidatus Omnitrophota bacterium]